MVFHSWYDYELEIYGSFDPRQAIKTKSDGDCALSVDCIKYG